MWVPIIPSWALTKGFRAPSGDRFLASLARLTVRSGRSKDLEIIVLRHQLAVLHRHNDRPALADEDRALLGAIAARHGQRPEPAIRCLKRIRSPVLHPLRPLQTLWRSHMPSPDRAKSVSLFQESVSRPKSLPSKIVEISTILGLTHQLRWVCAARGATSSESRASRPRFSLRRCQWGGPPYRWLAGSGRFAVGFVGSRAPRLCQLHGPPTATPWLAAAVGWGVPRSAAAGSVAGLEDQDDRRREQQDHRDGGRG